jgi:HAD superfamily hydrolase (TIGR01490 family)
VIPASHVGAFFDIDGTLLPPPSLEWRFVSWLLDSDLLSIVRIAKCGMVAASALLAWDARALRINKAYLAGLPTSVFEDWEASLPLNALTVFPQGAERLAYHFEHGHRVFFISGTLTPLARTLARRIGGAVGVYGTELGRTDGVYSGRIEGKHVSGSTKADVTARIAHDFGVSLTESHAYGNHLDDLAILDCVGHPVAVNPTRQLKRIAQHRHWRTTRWESSDPAATFARRQRFVSAKEAH